MGARREAGVDAKRRREEMLRALNEVNYVNHYHLAMSYSRRYLLHSKSDTMEWVATD